MNFWILLSLIYIEIIKAFEFVELKYNFISKGITVHHGFFLETGHYKLFIGYKDDLEYIYYGGEILYPKGPYKLGSHLLILETYEILDYFIIAIYDFERINGGTSFPHKYYFQLDNYTFERITAKKFFATVFDRVYVSLDLSEEIHHPFIHLYVEADDTSVITKFSVKRSYEGMSLRGPASIKYMIGRIYDTKRCAVSGYTKIRVLVSKSTSMEIERRGDFKTITIRRHCKNYLQYETRNILGTDIWFSNSDGKDMTLEKDNRESLMLKRKVDLVQGQMPLVTLDISEGITPELVGLEKVRGRLGVWDYTLFEVRREFLQTHKIRRVVDTDLENHVIFNSGDNSVNVMVEVFKDINKSVVFITSLNKTDTGFEKEIKMFQKGFEDSKTYTEIPSSSSNEMLTYFFEMFPIGIDVNIDEPPKYIYERGRSVFDGYAVDYYYIKDYDDLGNHLSAKYVFDKVLERQKYEKGNIPIETSKHILTPLRTGLNKTKFVVTENETNFPIQGTKTRQILTYEEVVGIHETQPQVQIQPQPQPQQLQAPVQQQHQQQVQVQIHPQPQPQVQQQQQIQLQQVQQVVQPQFHQQTEPIDLEQYDPQPQE